jgi:hypothetical protein
MTCKNKNSRNMIFFSLHAHSKHLTKWIYNFIIDSELSPSTAIQDLKCCNVLVCVNEWLSGTNIIYRICERKEVSFEGQAAWTSFRPGPWYFIHFLQGTPRLTRSFFPTGGWWIGYVGVIGFCGFLLFPSSFHFVLIKFTMGSPTCFK